MRGTRGGTEWPFSGARRRWAGAGRGPGRKGAWRLPPTLAIAAALTLTAVACGEVTSRGGGGGGQQLRRAIPVPDTVELGQLLAEVREHIPRRGSERYSDPSETEKRYFVDAVRLASRGQVEAANDVVESVHYDVVRTVDAASGASLLVILERIPVEAGWGTYVLNEDASGPVDVHLNHPVSDIDTPAVGAGIFERCSCRWLFMAGAHRHAIPDHGSDVARLPTSMFQRMYEEEAGPDALAVSVHGFARGNHDPPISGADAVVSPGGPERGEIAESAEPSRELTRRLEAEGWRVGLAGEDPGYEALAGTGNPQGQHAHRMYGRGRWVHLELARNLRSDPDDRETVVRAVVAWAAEIGGAGL